MTEWPSDQVTKWPSTQVTRKLRRRLTVWYIWIYKQCLFSFFFYLFPCITNSAAVLLTPDPSARADGGLSVATGSMSRGQYCKERSNLREIWLMLISIQQKLLFWRLFTSIGILNNNNFIHFQIAVTTIIESQHLSALDLRYVCKLMFLTVIVNHVPKFKVFKIYCALSRPLRNLISWESSKRGILSENLCAQI